MDAIAIPGFAEPVSSILHFIAVAWLVIASGILLRKSFGNGLRMGGVTLYSVCALYLFSMSAVYHLLSPGDARDVFQRLDHAAIWAMIAGTFTPLHLMLFRGFWRWGILGIVWTCAITGLVLEVIFFADFPEWLSLVFYLSLGWLGALSYWKIKKYYSRSTIRFMLYGGVTYSVGAVLEFARWPTLWPGVIGPHELFHVCVMLGAYYHWRFIFDLADSCVADQLTFLIKVRPNNVFYVAAQGEAITFKASSEEEAIQRIKESVNAKYENHMRPKALRLKYLREAFIDPNQSGRAIVSGDDFYR